jgi:hypothetical protein
VSGGYINHIQADEPIERVRSAFGDQAFERFLTLETPRPQQRPASQPNHSGVPGCHLPIARACVTFAAPAFAAFVLLRRRDA